MKKQVLFALAATLGIVGSTNLPAQAVGVEELCEKLKVEGYVVNVGQIGSVEDLKEILRGYGIDPDSFNWNDCPIVNLPGTDELETGLPGEEQPGQEAPETEQEAPGEQQPGQEESETEQPGQEVPETERPEQEAPETEKPATNTPGSTDSDEAFKNDIEQVVELVNAERAKAGLAALTLDEQLSSAALIRARESEISFSHTRPDGRSFSTVLTDQGITFRGAGENIAWGQKTPEEVMNDWMNSEGHRANILNPKFTKIGIGCYQNASGRKYWSQLFTY